MNSMKIWNWHELEDKVMGFWPISQALPAEILSGGNFQKKMRKALQMDGKREFRSNA